MDVINDLQFKIKKGNLRVRSTKSFREVLKLKHMQKEDMKEILFKKMGVEFSG